MVRKPGILEIVHDKKTTVQNLKSDVGQIFSASLKGMAEI